MSQMLRGQAAALSVAFVLLWSISGTAQGEATDFASSAVDVIDVSLSGLVGGFTDGTFGYALETFGKVHRIDLESFAASVEVVDLSATVPDIQSIHGGFAAGTFGYVWDEMMPIVVRFNLQNFDEVELVDVLTYSGYTLDELGTGFSDGTFGYLSSFRFFNGVRRVGRFNLQNPVEFDVLELTSPVPGFMGPAGQLFTDGTFGYSQVSGQVARFNLQNFVEVELLDLASSGADLTMFAGGFADGTFGYFVPSYKFPGDGPCRVARFNLQNFGNVEALNLKSTDTELQGFEGGFTDGTFGYALPSSYANGKVARFNLQNFVDVEILDLKSADTLLKFVKGGYTQGLFGYITHSTKVARFALLVPAPAKKQVKCGKVPYLLALKLRAKPCPV